MPPFETRSSQFGLISGIRQPNSDMVLQAAPAGLFTPEARKGQLFVVAEADQDVARGRDACQLVIHTIRKLFYDDSSFSVTSALRKAISAANKLLYEQNFSASPQKRAVVGVTCAVVKGNDLYIAQIQPAQAYVLAGGKLRALPPIPAWGVAPDITTFFKPGAVGASLSIEPEFYRAVLNIGDTLLMCTSNLTRLIGQNDATRLLRAVLLDDIADGLADMCTEHQITEGHGLIVGVRAALSPAAQAEPLSRAGITERGRLALRRAYAWAGRITGAAALQLQGATTRAQQQRAGSRLEQAQREQARLSEAQAEPPYSIAPPPRPHPLQLGESLDERIDQERLARRNRLGAAPLRPTETGDTPPSSFLGEGGYLTSPAERRIDLSDTPSMAALGKRSNPYGRPEIAPTLGERLTQPIAKIANAFTSMGRRRRLRRPPPRALPRARRAGLSYRRQSPPFPWIWLLVLILVIAAAVLYGMNLSREITVRQANDSLDHAATVIAALRSADESSAQSRLDAAALALADVRATGALTETIENRQRYEEMEREYERTLAATQKLTYFDDLNLIAMHPVTGGLFTSVAVPSHLRISTCSTATRACCIVCRGRAARSSQYYGQKISSARRWLAKSRRRPGAKIILLPWRRAAIAARSPSTSAMATRGATTPWLAAKPGAESTRISGPSTMAATCIFGALARHPTRSRSISAATTASSPTLGSRIMAGRRPTARSIWRSTAASICSSPTATSWCTRAARSSARSCRRASIRHWSRR